MTDIYNLTAVMDANGTIEWVQAVDVMSGGYIFSGLSIMMFVILFAYTMFRYGDYRKALLGASFLSFIVSVMFFMVVGGISWFLAIVYLIGTVIGVLMLRDKDGG